MYKIDKYKHLQIIEYAKRITQSHPIIFSADIINWRGAWSGNTAELQKISSQSKILKLLAVRCIQYGIYDYDIYKKSTAVEPSERSHALGPEHIQLVS